MNYRYGKEVLVTGGTSGIGRAVAMLFAEKGYVVYAVSRHAEPRREAVGAGEIIFLPMDVCEQQSVDRVAKSVKNIGIIIHCAGFGIGGSAEDAELEDVKKQLEVNYFGVLRVNRSFLPQMRERGGGMVVVVSSIAGQMPIPFQSHYSSSKYALEAYAEALRMETRAYGIRVTLVEPGDTATGFTSGRKLSIPESSPYREACLASIQKMEQDELHGDSPEKVAKVIYAVATRKNPPIRKAVGIQYQAVVFLKRLLPSRFVNYVLGRLYSGR